MKLQRRAPAAVEEALEVLEPLGHLERQEEQWIGVERDATGRPVERLLSDPGNRPAIVRPAQTPKSPIGRPRFDDGAGMVRIVCSRFARTS